MQTNKFQVIKSLIQQSKVNGLSIDPYIGQFTKQEVSMAFPIIYQQSTDSNQSRLIEQIPTTFSQKSCQSLDHQKQLDQAKLYDIHPDIRPNIQTQNGVNKIIKYVSACMQIVLCLIDTNDQLVQFGSLSSFEQFLQSNIGVNVQSETRDPIQIKQVNIRTIQISVKGKVQCGRSDIIITSGKNIGKKSETTILQQAIQEAQKKYLDIMKKKSSDYPHFMLLDLYHYQRQNQESDNKTQQLNYPQYVQRKYDGLRCGAFKQDFDIILMSRGHKQFTALTSISNQLKTLFNSLDNTDDIQEQLKNISNTTLNSANLLIDGELYIHNKPLQTLNSIIRNSNQHDKDSISFVIYDVDITINNRTVQLQLSFQQRLQILQLMKSSIDIFNLKNLNIAPTNLIQSKEDLDSTFQAFIELNYEGVVIRNPQSKYQYSFNNKRSHDSLKYKLKLDMEVKVVGYTDGQGKDANAIIFNCQLLDTSSNQPNDKKNTQIFQVVQNTSYDNRKSLFNLVNKNPKYIDILSNIPFNIEYSGLSNSGIPLQPRGIYFRTESVQFDIPVDLINLIE